MKNKEIEERLKDSLDYEFDLSFNERKELLLRIEQLEKRNESLLEDRKQLLNLVGQLKEEIAEYEFLIKTQNEREYRSKFLKEFQKEKGKNVYPDYDEIYKRYDEMKVELQDANVSVIWWQNRYNAVERDRKQLENNRDKAIRTLETLKGSARWERHLYEVDYIIDILKGDSDE